MVVPISSARVGVPPVVLTVVASLIVTVTLSTSPAFSVLLAIPVALVMATPDTPAPNGATVRVLVEVGARVGVPPVVFTVVVWLDAPVALSPSPAFSVLLAIPVVPALATPETVVAGAVVATVMLRVPAALVLPAASVCVALIRWLP